MKDIDQVVTLCHDAVHVVSVSWKTMQLIDKPESKSQSKVQAKRVKFKKGNIKIGLGCLQNLIGQEPEGEYEREKKHVMT